MERSATLALKKIHLTRGHWFHLVKFIIQKTFSFLGEPGTLRLFYIFHILNRGIIYLAAKRTYLVRTWGTCIVVSMEAGEKFFYLKKERLSPTMYTD